VAKLKGRVIALGAIDPEVGLRGRGAEVVEQESTMSPSGRGTLLDRKYHMSMTSASFTYILDGS
jgi:hypothetical protein